MDASLDEVRSQFLKSCQGPRAIFGIFLHFVSSAQWENLANIVANNENLNLFISYLFKSHYEKQKIHIFFGTRDVLKKKIFCGIAKNYWSYKNLVVVQKSLGLAKNYWSCKKKLYGLPKVFVVLLKLWSCQSLCGLTKTLWSCNGFKGVFFLKSK